MGALMLRVGTEVVAFRWNWRPYLSTPHGVRGTVVSLPWTRREIVLRRSKEHNVRW